jgi:hypothetical protein
VAGLASSRVGGLHEVRDRNAVDEHLEIYLDWIGLEIYLDFDLASAGERDAGHFGGCTGSCRPASVTAASVTAASVTAASVTAASVAAFVNYG